MSSFELQEALIHSSSLGNQRQVWLQKPPAGDPTCVCVFLDSEYYVDKLGAPAILAELQESGQVPPLLVAHVSHIDDKIRWPESFCNPDFDRFVVEELFPWLVHAHGLAPSCDWMIAGLSLTGLSAAHAALASDNRISRVLCQSASFWWEEGRFRKSLADQPPSDAKFRISVGTDETNERVYHGDGLFQEESQRDANRKTRDALIARGHPVSYHEFSGGHDIESLRADLPEGLVALFQM